VTGPANLTLLAEKPDPVPVAASPGLALARSFFAVLDRLVAEWDLQGHEFFKRWTGGALDRRELQVYASEFYVALMAVATVTRRAAHLADGMLAEALAGYSEAKVKEIHLWWEFARGTGWCHSEAWCFAEDPLPETVSCARSWIGRKSRPLAEHLTTLIVIERTEPEFSRMMLDGLREHGIRPSSAAYFITRERRHADDAVFLKNGLIALFAAGMTSESLALHAEAVYRGYWGLLDGVAAPVESPAASAAIRRPNRQTESLAGNMREC
jgi:pyrroloquinoline quinone (PQQ) biosynthesis protein C